MYGFNIYISVAIWLGGKEGGFPLNLELAWARGAPKFGPPSPLRSLWVPWVILKIAVVFILVYPMNKHVEVGRPSSL